MRKKGKNESNASDSIPLAQVLVDALDSSSAVNATPNLEEDNDFDFSVFNVPHTQVDSTALMEKINRREFDKALELISKNNARFADADEMEDIYPFLQWLLDNKNVEGLQQSIDADAVTNRFKVLQKFGVEAKFIDAVEKYLTSQDDGQRKNALQLVKLYHQFYKSHPKNVFTMLIELSGENLVGHGKLRGLLEKLFNNSNLNAQLKEVIGNLIAKKIKEQEYGGAVTLIEFLKENPEFLNLGIERCDWTRSFYAEKTTALVHLLLLAVFGESKTSDCIFQWYNDTVVKQSIGRTGASDQIMCDLLSLSMQRKNHGCVVPCDAWVKAVDPLLPHLSEDAIIKKYTLNNEQLSLLQMPLRLSKQFRQTAQLAITPLIETALSCVNNPAMPAEKKAAWNGLLTKRGGCGMYVEGDRFLWQDLIAVRDFRSASLLLHYNADCFDKQTIRVALQEYVCHTSSILPDKALQGINGLSSRQVFYDHVMPLFNNMLTLLPSKQASLLCMELIGRDWIFKDRGYDVGKCYINVMSMLLRGADKELFDKVCAPLNIKDKLREAKYLSTQYIRGCSGSSYFYPSNVNKILELRGYSAEVCFKLVDYLINSYPQQKRFSEEGYKDRWKFGVDLFFLVYNRFTLKNESETVKKQVKDLWKNILRRTLVNNSKILKILPDFWSKYGKTENKDCLELDRNEIGAILDGAANKAGRPYEYLSTILNYFGDWLGLSNSLSLQHVFRVIMNVNLATEQRLSLIKKYCIKDNKGRFYAAVELYYEGLKGKANKALATKYFELFVQAVINENYYIAAAMAKVGFLGEYTIDSDIQPMLKLELKKPTTLLQYFTEKNNMQVVKFLKQLDANPDAKPQGSEKSAYDIAMASRNKSALCVFNKGRGAWSVGEFCNRIAEVYKENRGENQSSKVAMFRSFKKVAFASLDKFNRNNPAAKIIDMASRKDLSGISEWLSQRAGRSRVNATPNGTAKLSASQKTMKQLRLAHRAKKFEGRMLSQEIMDQLNKLFPANSAAEAVPTVSYASSNG